MAACGGTGYFGMPERVGFRAAQIAYVLDPDNNGIDEHKTKKIFGKPTGDTLAGVGSQSDGDAFRPIGESMGVFEYQGTYYFDTFFTVSDFQGQRSNYKNIQNVLGVFKHEHGKTEQICEYLMAGDDYDITYYRRMGRTGK